MTMICVDKCLNIFEYDEFITPKYNMTNNHKRSMAFTRLKDAPKHLYKTKMCTRKNCDKKNCNFAHSVAELRTVKCFFGKDCKFHKLGKCKLSH